MKRAGFILANQLLAATIITVAIAFFAINYQALMRQKRLMDEQLVAARLIKEAVDDPHYGTFRSGEMTVSHGRSQVAVTKDGRVVMQLCIK